jgi:hypothetical protein
MPCQTAQSHPTISLAVGLKASFHPRRNNRPSPTQQRFATNRSRCGAEQQGGGIRPESTTVAGRSGVGLRRCSDVGNQRCYSCLGTKKSAVDGEAGVSGMGKTTIPIAGS